MAEKRDYYEVLGVQRDAGEAQLSEAYRKLALQYHPDRNPGDDEAMSKFKEAAEAFEVLSHPEKRARYDRYGFAGLEGGGAPQFHDVTDIFNAFGDIFGQGFFGDFFGGRGRARVRKGADIRCEVTFDLIEAARGTSRSSVSSGTRNATTCRGTGAKPGTRPEPCRYCGGRGRVVQASRHLLDANHLPRLPRPRPGDPRRLPRLRAARATCRNKSPAKWIFRPASTSTPACA